MRVVQLLGYTGDVAPIPDELGGGRMLILAAKDGSESIQFGMSDELAQLLGNKLLAPSLLVVDGHALPAPAMLDDNGDKSA